MNLSSGSIFKNIILVVLIVLFVHFGTDRIKSSEEALIAQNYFNQQKGFDDQLSNLIINDFLSGSREVCSQSPCNSFFEFKAKFNGENSLIKVWLNKVETCSFVEITVELYLNKNNEVFVARNECVNQMSQSSERL